MIFLDKVAAIIGGVLTPASLLITFVFLLRRVHIFKILSPKRFVRAISDVSDNSKITPIRALCLALAGTLGVGNITGVASALICGGPGAIFWMWAGALVSISVKYAEVYLAVLFRKKSKNGYSGGAMYYIRDGFGGQSKYSQGIASIFAVLCCLNSLITGNLIQSNSAASVIPSNRYICGIVLAILVLISLLYGTHRIEKITSAVIPILCGVFILVSICILVANIACIPEILVDILSSAFAFRSVVGGAVGFSVRGAIRFGVMRGIFSNEAGSGTSPTAHASAETKGPHNQGCYGIIEVVFDTLVLCTITAFVLLIADKKYGIIPWLSDADNAVVSLEAYECLTSPIIYYVLTASVILFAYATIIAQIYYGRTAIAYLTNSKLPLYFYYFISVMTPILGSAISPGIMWIFADIVIGLMTVINCTVIVMLRKKISPPQD